MKKLFTFLFAFLLVATVFGQANNKIRDFKGNAVPQNHQVLDNSEKANWYGNPSSFSHFDKFETSYEIIIRPEKFTATVGASITKVRFRTYDPSGTTSQTYTNNSFTIKIYEGVDASSIDAVGGDYTTCLGTAVYTQNHTQTAYGDNEVTLTTPYTITNQPFWISVVANGPTLFLFNLDPIVEGISLTQYQTNIDTYFAQANNSYLYTTYDEDEFTDVVHSNFNAMYEDASMSTIVVSNSNYCLAYYLEDGQAYQATADLSANFWYPSTGTSFTSIGSDITLNSLTEDLAIVPGVTTSGPDIANTGVINCIMRINGVEYSAGNSSIDLTEEGLETGYLVSDFIYDPLTIPASYFNAQNLYGDFAITYSFTYTGTEIDPNPSNNTATLNVHRPQQQGGEPATYTISGTVLENGIGLAGVTITYTGGTTTTAANGTYSFTIEEGNNCTITPSKTDYTFAPQNITLNNITANMSNQNFTATSTAVEPPANYMVSGKVTFSGLALSQITINHNNGSVQTDNNGNYSFTVAAGTTVVITPSSNVYAFSPANITIENISSDMPNQDFAAALVSVETNNIDKLSVYPNPSNGIVNILSNETGTVIVYDITGKTIYQNEINSYENLEIELTTGMYFVKINNNIQKIVVK